VQLFVLPEKMAICKLDAKEQVPAWAEKAFSITRSDEELSIVCEAKEVPETITQSKHWVMLKIAGPLDFNLVGILASIAVPLAKVDISIFVLSTFDTDYILVKEEKREESIQALREAGFTMSLP